MESIAKKCRAENKAVQRVKEALRVTLNWKAPSVGMPRKLESVLFIVRALKRHLERMLALEEDGGYLADVVAEERPDLRDQADRLLGDHEEFRKALDTLVPLVERLRPADEARFNALCNEIGLLLERIGVHDQKEADLLLEALWQDEGGEG